MMPEQKRCAWGKGPEILRVYHDTEWGIPLHDDKRHFELLCLEGAQAGLNWLLVLQRREAYRELFEGFDPKKVAGFTGRKIQALLRDVRIIRNRLKIKSAVSNAKAFLKVEEEFGSFDAYIWRFSKGKPIIHKWKTMRQIPARTALSDAISKDLKERGFSFVGSTICYAYMQSIGMVNDHTVDCFCYERILREHGS